jgi:hypothetical protein
LASVLHLWMKKWSGKPCCCCYNEHNMSKKKLRNACSL